MDAKTKSYLMKQLAVEKNIVTYRSLSRALSIHVSLAKEYLSQYLEEASDCHPQYLVSGAPKRTLKSDDDWDMDDDDILDPQPSRFRCTLARADELDKVKTTFKTCSVYVHNLAPAVIQDSSHIAGIPWDIIRAADVAGGSELAEKVGRVVGADVKQAFATRGKGKGKTKATAKAAAPAVFKAKEIATTTPSTAQSEPSAAEAKKLKAAGTLDWSKAKAKDAKKPDEVKKIENGDASTKDREKPSATVDIKVKAEPKAMTADKRKAEVKAEDPPQRALKRKSEAPNKSEAEETSSRLAKASLAPEPAKKASSSASVSLTQKVEPPKTARRKNNIVLSDEDEEDDQPVRAPAKSIPVARPKRKALAGSDDEDDLDKMMNLDDSEVVHASKVREATTPPDTDDGMSNIDHHEEMYMDEDIDDVPKPKRKKKEKKVVPVGKNGIPKRRLVNTRTTLDAKGFMVAEDYSEYESTDGEEAPSKKPSGGKKLKAATSGVVKKAAPADTKPAPKKTAAAPPKGNQKGIGSFFTKKT